MELVPVVGYAHKRFTSWRNARRIVSQKRGEFHEGVLYVFAQSIQRAEIVRPEPEEVGEPRKWLSAEPGEGGPIVNQLETGYEQ